MNIKVSLQDFSAPEYYLNKLDREIVRLQKAQEAFAKDDVEDHGINAAITAWHLPEWVLRSRDSPNNPNDFRNMLIKKNDNFGLMHDITTQAKHFLVSKPKSLCPIEVRVSARLNYTENEQNRIEENIENPDQSCYMRLTNPPQIILKINGREALPIFKDIYKFLEKELFSEPTKQIIEQ